MGAVAQYLNYSSSVSKFVSSNPATLNAFTVGDLLFKSQMLWRVLMEYHSIVLNSLSAVHYQNENNEQNMFLFILTNT